MRPLASVAALLVLTCLPAVASAQAQTRPGITPVSRPTTSPYLNLNRAGTPAGVNLYQLVRPEFAFRNSIQGLQADVDTNRQLLTTGRDAPAQGGLVTGHSATFLNNGGYFLNLGGGRGSAPVTGAGSRIGVGAGGGSGAPKGKGR